eukprot:COSAG02_NODE_11550_length_1701_cov_1.491261_1_plen_79_part_10
MHLIPENLGTACPPDCSARLSQCLADISDCRQIHSGVSVNNNASIFEFVYRGILYTQEMGVMVAAEKNMAGIGGRGWP